MEPTPVLEHRTPVHSQRGFTLIEMLVVLAILLVIVMVTVSGQTNFNKSILLTDTTYDVAFSLRQAQSYGIASRNFNGSINNAGYGIHFDRVTPDSYIFFADTASTSSRLGTCPTGQYNTITAKRGNCRFDLADGRVSTFTFSRGFKILRFCGLVGTNNYECSDSQTGNQLQTLDIAFTRPNTSAIITATMPNGSPRPYSCAIIDITDPTGQVTSSIKVSSYGEITIGRSLICT